MTAADELQRAIFELLSASPAIQELAGLEGVLDHVPPGRKPPYILFESITSTAWGTPMEPGEEHDLRISVWSSSNGRRQAVAISEAVVDVLSGMTAIGSGHHLVNLALRSLRSDRQDNGALYRVEIAIRAVTEAAA